MFTKDFTMKTEYIVIRNSKDEFIKVSLSLNQDDQEIYVSIQDMNDPDMFSYWGFYIEEYFGTYFDIRNIVDFVIKKSDNFMELIGMLNEVFENELYDKMTDSSFFEEVNVSECANCEKKDNCEEYLMHKN